jgi:hypothetical protein
VELRKHAIWNQYRSQFPVHTQDEEQFSEEMMKGWSTNSILFCKQQNGQCSPTWVAVSILQLPKDEKTCLHCHQTDLEDNGNTHMSLLLSSGSLQRLQISSSKQVCTSAITLRKNISYFLAHACSLLMISTR